MVASRGCLVGLMVDVQFNLVGHMVVEVKFPQLGGTMVKFKSGSQKDILGFWKK